VKLFKMEPEICKGCQSPKPMVLTTATVDNEIYEGWICDDCGHFHPHKKITLKKHDDECDCPSCNRFEP